MKRLTLPALLAAGLYTIPALAGTNKCGPAPAPTTVATTGAMAIAGVPAPAPRLAWPPQLSLATSPVIASTLATAPALLPATAATPVSNTPVVAPRLAGEITSNPTLSILTPTPTLFNIYVPAGGDIAAAAANALPGTTIHVAPGTYNVSAPGLGDVGMMTSSSGTAAAHIRFVSDVPGAAKIVVSGTGIAWASKGNYVDIKGFDISGSGRHGILAYGSNLVIADNFIHDLTVSGGCNGSGGAAIDTNGGAGNVLIYNNTVRNIGASMVGKCNTVQGIYIANPNNMVINNTVSGVAMAGIQQWHGGTASTITGNTVSGSKTGILIGQGDSGQTAGGSANNYVANNTVTGNLAYGIIEYGAVGGNNMYVSNAVTGNGKDMQVAGIVK